MDEAIKEKSVHRSREILDRLEGDPIFRQTTDRMIAEILDTPNNAGDGSAKSHTIWISKELLKPHMNNLRISVIDGYRAGNMRNFLVWHNGYRRLVEISVESVENDCTGERIKAFGLRRERAEEV